VSELLTARELKERIEKNDRRCTAMPYLLLLRETRKVSCDPDFNYDGTEYVEQLSGDYKSFKTKKEAIQWLAEDDPDYEYKKGDVVKWHYQEVDETKNVFLTDKGYEEHLKINRHNLRDYHSYGIHAFRNREVESLFSLIDTCIEQQQELNKLGKVLSVYREALEFYNSISIVVRRIDVRESEMAGEVVLSKPIRDDGEKAREALKKVKEILSELP
jgi:hypothetical protein